MNIILVEDDQFKLNKIHTFLSGEVPDAKIHVAKSVNLAKRMLVKSDFSLAVFDMSLPTFNVGNEEAGGRPQVFGGKEMFRFLKRKEIVIPTIVVTQFERFGKGDRSKDIKTLEEEIASEYPESFSGLVYYDTNEEWLVNFSMILKDILK